MLQREGSSASRDIGFLTVGDSTVRWFLETEFNERHPQVSPDGRWLAYTSDRSGRDEVYVNAIGGEGGRTQISTNGGTSPRWSPDGDTLYYVSATTLIAATVIAQDGFRVTDRSPLFDGLTDIDDAAVNYDVHPNGQEFVVIDQRLAEDVVGLVWILNWPEIIRSLAVR